MLFPARFPTLFNRNVLLFYTLGTQTFQNRCKTFCFMKTSSETLAFGSKSLKTRGSRHFSIEMWYSSTLWVPRPSKTNVKRHFSIEMCYSYIVQVPRPSQTNVKQHLSIEMCYSAILQVPRPSKTNAKQNFSIENKSWW